MTLMNLFHDASHVLLWAVIGYLMSGRPLLSMGAYALCAFTAMWTARNIVHREYILSRRKTHGSD